MGRLAGLLYPKRFCRDNLVLHGHKLCALDVCGCPSNITNISRIFERPLPHLEYAKINFSPPCVEWSGYLVQGPVFCNFRQACRCGCSISSMPRYPGLPTFSPNYVNYTWTSLNVIRLWRFQRRNCLGFLTLPHNWRICRQYDFCRKPQSWIIKPSPES